MTGTNKMNKLLLLTGGIADNDPVAPPSTNEPYRVIWNPIVVRPNQQDYILQTNDPNWPLAIKNTGVLTHHAPLDYDPVMLCGVSNPMDNGDVIYTNFNARTPFPLHDLGQFSAYSVKDLHKIAYLDRTGRLPKVFQIRFGTERQVDEFYPMIIFLDKRRTNFIGVKAVVDEPTGVFLQLVYRINDYSATSPLRKVEDFSRFFMTDSVRLVIFNDKVQLYYGDPGTLLDSHALYERIVVRESAHFALFHEPLHQRVNQYLCDGLYIYDGYY